jgi:hypothetical protein
MKHLIILIQLLSQALLTGKIIKRHHNLLEIKKMVRKTKVKERVQVDGKKLKKATILLAFRGNLCKGLKEQTSSKQQNSVKYQLTL